MKIISEEQFDELCLNLENDADFHSSYKAARTGSTGVARNVIAQHAKKFSIPHRDSYVHLREDLRQYFDERYGISPREEKRTLLLSEHPHYYFGCSYGKAPPDPVVPPTITSEKEEPTMAIATALKITTKTLVNDLDISTMSASNIYQIIADQEAEMSRLALIKNKPKMLEAELAERQAGVDALVAHLDSRAATV